MVVVPDGGGEREEPLKDSDQDALGTVAGVAFELSLVLRVALTDSMIWRRALSWRAPRAGSFVAARGAYEFDAVVGEVGLELGGRVALVRDDRLAGPSSPQGRVGVDQIDGDLAFVDFGVANAKVMGSPAGVATRCSRSPQKYREWLAQEP